MPALTAPELPPLIVNGTPEHRYVLTYTNTWNKDKKRSVRTQSKCVGRLEPFNGDPDVLKSLGIKDPSCIQGQIIFSGEFEEKHPELENLRVFRRKGGKLLFLPEDGEGMTLEMRLKVQKLSGGATWALNRINSQSPFGKALRACFAKYHCDRKLLSLIYFLVLRRDQPLSNFDEFTEAAWLPWQRPLSGSSVSRILGGITKDKALKCLRLVNEESEALRKQAGKEGRRYMALDSASISAYAHLASAEWGHNKDHDPLPQTSVMLVADQETGLPAYFRDLDGNVPDAKTVRNTIAELAAVGIPSADVVFVSDRGFVSSDNVDDFLRNGLSFIFNTRAGSTQYVQELIDAHRTGLLDWNSENGFLGQTVATEKLEWKYDAFPVDGKRSSKRDTATVWAHIYYDRKIADADYDALRSRLTRLRESLDAGAEPDGSDAETAAAFIAKDPKTGKHRIDMVKANESLKYSGFRVLISDCIEDPVECSVAYSDRNSVEEAFRTMKDRLKLDRVKSHTDRSWHGRLFLQMMAVSLAIMVRQRVKAWNDKEKLKKASGRGGYRVMWDSDRKLLAKLENIRVTRYGDGWYFDEIAGKKKELFEILDVALPEASGGARRAADAESEEEIAADADEKERQAEIEAAKNTPELL